MWIPVAIGGVCGTLARFGVQHFVGARAPHSFPVGTLIINLAGSLVLGLVMGYAAATGTLGTRLQGGLTVGFCGAFTTMSAFAFETTSLLAAAQYGRAALYLAVTIIGSIGSVALGIVVAQRIA
jgi:CrcB protein